MCREYDVILYYYGELSDKDEFLCHLANCASCKKFLESLKDVSQTYRNSVKEIAGEALSWKIQSKGMCILSTPPTHKIMPRYILCGVMVLLVILAWPITFFLKHQETRKTIITEIKGETDWKTLAQDIKRLGTQIETFERKMSAPQQSYFEYSIELLREKIGTLSKKIEKIDTKEVKYE